MFQGDQFKIMLRSLFLHNVVYYVAGSSAVFFAASYFWPDLRLIGELILVLLLLCLVVDLIFLYSNKDGISASRETGARFSIGDENRVILHVQNKYGFSVKAYVIDEIPLQFQVRDWCRVLQFPSHSGRELIYTLRPLERGEYVFHDINVYVQAPLSFLRRRYIIPAEEVVKVYPSYMQMRRYQLLAISNRLQELGVRKVRRIGHSMEFEQIKEYVRGDDYRTINWKATARKDALMVNNYTDERSQQIYCLLNKGRVMKMPFNGLTLLDHAINATLVLSNVALVKQDRAGLICFEKEVDVFLPADKKPTQMNQVLETLYRQDTAFLEPDLEKLFSVIRNRISTRSLLVLFSNYESMESLQRELPALKKIARYHLLMVVFFENTELKSMADKKVNNLEDIYIKTIADKFIYEKKLMVKELQKNGIISILTSPENLTVNTVNKYLELKTRMSI